MVHAIIRFAVNSPEFAKLPKTVGAARHKVITPTEEKLI